MPGLTQMPTAPQPAPIDLQLPKSPPTIPDEVIKRFPEMQQWSDDLNQWYEGIVQALTDANQAQSTQINQQVTLIASLQAAVEDQANGAYSAGVVPAIGTVVIQDSLGVAHNALVAT